MNQFSLCCSLQFFPLPITQTRTPKTWELSGRAKEGPPLEKREEEVETLHVFVPKRVTATLHTLLPVLSVDELIEAW